MNKVDNFRLHNVAKLNQYKSNTFRILQLKNSKENFPIFVRFKKGPVAEWLGKALQKLLQRFESARDLFFFL